MINTQEQLLQVFRDNFVAYFRSHVAHANIQGRNFYSDHKLLGKIYQHLQSQIDTQAELLRSTGEFMPTNLQTVIVDATIEDEPCEGSAQELLMQVRDNLTELVSCLRDLGEAASDEDQEEIENYAQEQILILNKFLWMLDSTLSPEQ